MSKPTDQNPPDGSGQSSKEAELTPAAREAIWGYVLKVITPAGAALAVIAFLLGFFVNEVARKQAYETAFAEMNKKVDDTTARATKRVDDLADQAAKTRVTMEVANERSVLARQQTEKNLEVTSTRLSALQRDAEKAANEVTRIAEQVRSVEIFKLVAEKQDEFVRSLATNEAFVSRVGQAMLSPDLTGTYTPYFADGPNRGLIRRAVAIVQKKGDGFEVQWFDDAGQPGEKAEVRYVPGKPGELTSNRFINYSWGKDPQPPKVSGPQRGTVTGPHLWWNNGEHWVRAEPDPR
jgi:hypothetical protein